MSSPGTCLACRRATSYLPSLLRRGRGRFFIRVRPPSIPLPTNRDLRLSKGGSERETPWRGGRATRTEDGQHAWKRGTVDGEGCRRYMGRYGCRHPVAERRNDTLRGTIPWHARDAQVQARTHVQPTGRLHPGSTSGTRFGERAASVESHGHPMDVTSAAGRVIHG